MKIQNDILSKYKDCEKILTVVWYFILVIGLLMLAVAIVLGISYAAGSFPYKNVKLDLESFGMGVSIDGTLVSPSVFIALLANAVPAWVLILYLFSQFRKMLKSFVENRTPFAKENIARLKKMSYSLFKYAAAAFLIKCAASPIINSKAAFGKVDGIEFHADLSIPLWPIFFGLLILGISHIFGHGLLIEEDNESII